MRENATKSWGLSDLDAIDMFLPILPIDASPECN
jgi:hypothetical protein